MIRLSLIIATYNRAEPLIEALNSVVLQSASPAEWECVVVNNNSNDNTTQRFNDFATNYKSLKLRLVEEPRQGLSHARNRGIAESVGEYIAIIDDDERINADFVAAYIKFFDAHPEVAAAGGRIVPDYPSGRPAWMSSFTEKPIANPIDLGCCERQFPSKQIPGGGNMALRRSTIEKYGAFNPALGRTGQKLIGGEESDLFERLTNAGESIWYVPNAVMWHIIPPQKLTKEYFTRLSYNIGVSQRTRAKMNSRYFEAIISELIKWGATIIFGVWYLITLNPQKAKWLFKMRLEITKGLTQG